MENFTASITDGVVSNPVAKNAYLRALRQAVLLANNLADHSTGWHRRIAYRVKDLAASAIAPCVSAAHLPALRDAIQLVNKLAHHSTGWHQRLAYRVKDLVASAIILCGAGQVNRKREYSPVGFDILCGDRIQSHIKVVRLEPEARAMVVPQVVAAPAKAPLYES